MIGSMETRDPLRFLQLEVARLSDENRDLKQELTMLRSSVRALSALQDIIQRMTPEMDPLVLIDDLLASALAVVGASDGSLLLRDEETKEMVFAVVHGEARERLTGYRLPPQAGIAGWVVEHKRPLVVRNVREDPRFYPKVDEAFGFHTRSLACVPLMDAERILGVLEVVNKNYDREFTDQDHDLMMVVAHLASIAILRAEAFSAATP
jgi:phosphoserine phosphatase RsbU/P